MFKEITYRPLNLYSQFKEAAEAFPETTGRLASFGISQSDKVMLYKSASFATYLLAVAVTYLGAVPVMVSYHLPSSTLDVFA